MRLGLGHGLDVGYRSELFGATAPTYLLDTYSGAAVAYSLRQLKTGVTNVVRVRRSSDDAEADFTASQVISGALTSWTGPNDGFVVTWYDQSGNGRNMTNATAVAQGKIVNAGALVTQNGKPAILLDGTDDGYASGWTGLTVGTGFYAFSVFASTDTTGIKYWATTTQWAFITQDGSSSTALSDRFFIASIYKNNSIQSLATRDDWYTAFNDGSQHISYLTGTIALNDWTNFRLYNYTGISMGGYAQEEILFTADPGSNRTPIHTAINSHYSIY